MDQAFDAYAALRYLLTMKIVDAERVALFGQPMGGSATLYAIDRSMAAQYFGGVALRSPITPGASSFPNRQ